MLVAAVLLLPGGRGSKDAEPAVVASFPSQPNLPDAGGRAQTIGESGEGPSEAGTAATGEASKRGPDKLAPVPLAPKTTGAPKPADRPPGEPAKKTPSPAEPAKAAVIEIKSDVKMEPKPPEPLQPTTQSIESAPKAVKQRDAAGTKKKTEPDEKAVSRGDKEKIGHPSPPQSAARLPVPDAAAQKAAKSEVREVYRARFAQSRSPIDKGLLAGELFRQATETKDNPLVRYVLLAEARDLAVAGGDSTRLREAVLEMAKGYEVDALQEQARVLSEAAESPLPSLVRNSLGRAAVGLAQEAIQADEYEAARQLAKAGFSLASSVIVSKGRDVQTIRQATELSESIPWYKEQHDRAQAAEKALRQDADNAKAILFLGKYYTLVKDQWPRGLPLLVKSGDPTLKALAEAELAMRESPEPAEMATLGDQWMAAVPAVEKPMQGFVRRRALHWYETALPRLSGFTQSRVARAVQDLKEGELNRRKP